MNSSEHVNIWELTDLCTPWCVHVVATLQIADHIAAGKTHIDDLAAAAGAHADSLQRVLRHLVSKGLFEQPAPGQFALNEAALSLLGPAGRIGFGLDGIGGRMAYAWGSLLKAVRTGAPAYHEVFGHPFWEDLAANPTVAESFDALMGVAGHGIPDPDVLLTGDWESIRTLVDVGGGTGTFLAEVLRAHPHVRGTLVDFPQTVARSTEIFASTGVSSRVTTVGQSFFDPLPPGADLYVVKSVLHDWPDEEAMTLLKRCAEAARPSGRVVLPNGVSPDEKGEASPELLMMILVGGKARTLSEFRKLASTAGLEVLAAAHKPSWKFVVECRPQATTL